MWGEPRIRGNTNRESTDRHATKILVPNPGKFYPCIPRTTPKYGSTPTNPNSVNWHVVVSLHNKGDTKSLAVGKLSLHNKGDTKSLHNKGDTKSLHNKGDTKSLAVGVVVSLHNKGDTKSLAVGKLSLAVGKVSLAVGKVSLAVGKLALAVGKVPLAVGKVSLAVGKVSLAVGKVSLVANREIAGIRNGRIKHNKKMVGSIRSGVEPGYEGIRSGVDLRAGVRRY